VEARSKKQRGEKSDGWFITIEGHSKKKEGQPHPQERQKGADNIRTSVWEVALALLGEIRTQ